MTERGHCVTSTWTNCHHINIHNPNECAHFIQPDAQGHPLRSYVHNQYTRKPSSNAQKFYSGELAEGLDTSGEVIASEISACALSNMGKYVCEYATPMPLLL